DVAPARRRVQDAVVHERRRLVAANRPGLVGPYEAQTGDGLVVDLIERAEPCLRVVASVAEPLLWRSGDQALVAGTGCRLRLRPRKRDSAKSRRNERDVRSHSKSPPKRRRDDAFGPANSAITPGREAENGGSPLSCSVFRRPGRAVRSRPVARSRLNMTPEQRRAATPLETRTVGTAGGPAVSASKGHHGNRNIPQGHDATPSGNESPRRADRMPDGLRLPDGFDPRLCRHRLAARRRLGR